LTFDDGPDPASTPGVLDVLARHRALATFFVLVDGPSEPGADPADARGRPRRRLHGLDHQRLTRLDRQLIAGHITSGLGRLTAVSGRKPRWFRPPYGSQDLRSYVAARRCGMDVVVWSADCEDWVQRPEEEIAQQAVDAARPGGVLLLHDSIASDTCERIVVPLLDRPAIAARVLEGLSKRGYQRSPCRRFSLDAAPIAPPGFDRNGRHIGARSGGIAPEFPTLGCASGCESGREIAPPRAPFRVLSRKLP
jgi:hypothetical protein